MSVEQTITVRLKSVRRTKQDILALFTGLSFSEKTHSYRFDKEDLVNASSFSSKLMPPFNPEMSNIVAKSKGAKGLPSNPDYYTQRWAFKRDEAANRGSRVHLYAEQYPILDDAECPLEQGVCNFYDFMEQEGYEVICMELRMTDGVLAGTCDLLLRHKITGKYVIADWKTNAKDIEAINYYNKPIVLLPHLQDTDKNKFACQLSIYSYLLAKKGIIVEELWLIHLSETMHEDNFKVIKVPTIDLEPMLQEGQPLMALLGEFKVELAEKKAAREAKWKNKY
jgi:hypothetical protein